MSFLEEARATLEQFIPGLDETLASHPLEKLEQPGSPAIQLFRDLKGPALLVPADLGGHGASCFEALRVHRAIAARAPSLSIAATMHNFSVATVVEYRVFERGGEELLSGVADQQMLVASGFAEGRSGASLLAGAAMRAEPVDAGYRISGSKKPCSLAYSLDVLTAGVSVHDAQGRTRRAIAMVPATAPGISRRPFWRSPVLAGAESDELVLEGVVIPEELMIFPKDEQALGAAEIGGLCWFEVLIAASYLGIASALLERVLGAGKGGPGERALLAIELEGSQSTLDGTARWIDDHAFDVPALSRALCARFAVQAAIERAAARAAELCGGIAFMASGDVAYLLAASRALAYHPPSRIASARFLEAHLTGGDPGIL